MIAFLTCMRWYIIAVLICSSLMISNVEYLFMCLLPPLGKCLFGSSAHFSINQVIFLYWVVWSDYIVSTVYRINPLVIIVVVVMLVAQSCLTLRPHGLYPARLLCPWDSPGKNTGMGCHSLLQRIFPTQGSNPVSFIAGKFFSHHVTCKYFLPFSRLSFHFVSGFLKTLLSILLDIYQ